MVLLFMKVRLNHSALICSTCSTFYILQVGDVVLVQDESIMENELKIAGLDTLV